MKTVTLRKAFLVSAAICALALSVPKAVRADVASSGPINNGMWYQFWRTSDYGVSFNQNYNGNYSVSWNSNVTDFTCGVGWATGDWRQVGYNCGAFSMNGFGSFGLYGWFTSPPGSGQPDTEYYIIEMSAGNHASGTYYGSINADGGTYDIYHNYNPNNHGISGAPLEQWISVRRGNNTVGRNHTISTWIHYNAWASLGWRRGNWNSQVLGVEGGFGGSGYVNATAWWN